MKSASLMRIVMGAAGLMTIGIPCAHAQAEINPDHFALSNTEAFQARQASVPNQAAQVRPQDCATAAQSSAQCAGANREMAARKHSNAPKSASRVAPQEMPKRSTQAANAEETGRIPGTSDGLSALRSTRRRETRDLSAL